MLQTPIVMNIGQLMASKPATRYVANVYPVHGGKFMAQWAAPGMIPAFAKRGGRVLEFDSEAEAEVEAAAVLIEALNSRKRDTSKPERYERLTGPEFAVLLAEAGLTATFFAYLYGTSQDRVLKWMDGADGVPHPARLILEEFKANLAAIDRAEKVTESITTERKPRRAQD